MIFIIPIRYPGDGNGDAEMLVKAPSKRRAIAKAKAFKRRRQSGVIALFTDRCRRWSDDIYINQGGNY